jgi:5-methylcytosine-specific restriction protein B
MADLSLVGSGVSDAEVSQYETLIAERGGLAGWWSFPIRAEFQSQLSTPFYLYLNSGGARITHRMRVEEFATSRGNEGIPTPWPELTNPEWRAGTRAGLKTSEIFKTWLRISKIERLPRPLSLSDFDVPPGINPAGVLNQAAFGYVYLKGASARVVPERTEQPVNLILYGPPGTGKTYWLRQQFARYTDAAEAVDEGAWLHQVLGKYGWRSVIAAALADLGGRARVPDIREHRWIQAKRRERNRTANVHQTIWHALQQHTPESNAIVLQRERREPYIFDKLAEGDWALLPDWRNLDGEAAELADLLAGGPHQSHDALQRYRVVTFHPSFSYEDFIRGIRPVATDDDDGVTQFRFVDGVLKRICDEAAANPSKRYALFIDEINRANIAKVFGELIALIEVDKRIVVDENGRVQSGMTVQLPGSESDDRPGPDFGVPSNLDIYGTMNTADRSIALLDIALRRRFEFREMEPDYALLDRSLGVVHLGKLLARINDRLEFLLDRDHRVGHAYLMQAQSIDDLRRVFRVQIIPLLQEYFFDDLSRVAMVLGTGSQDPQLIARERLHRSALFTSVQAEDIPVDRTRYVVNSSESWTEASFAGIYQATANSDELKGDLT